MEIPGLERRGTIRSGHGKFKRSKKRQHAVRRAAIAGCGILVQVEEARLIACSERNCSATDRECDAPAHHATNVNCFGLVAGRSAVGRLAGPARRYATPGRRIVARRSVREGGPCVHIRPDAGGTHWDVISKQYRELHIIECHRQFRSTARGDSPLLREDELRLRSRCSAMGCTRNTPAMNPLLFFVWMELSVFPVTVAKFSPATTPIRFVG